MGPEVILDVDCILRRIKIYLKLDEPRAEMVKRLLNVPRKLHTMALTAPMCISIKNVVEDTKFLSQTNDGSCLAEQKL